MKCFRRLLLPLLLLGIGALVASLWSTNRVEKRLAVVAGNCLERNGIAGVSLDKMDGQDAYLSGPASLEDQAVTAIEGCDGYDKAIYRPETAAAPATTVVQVTTTAFPTTTAAPTTTRTPATSAAPTSTAAPTTTAAPVTSTNPAATAAPRTVCPADLPISARTQFDSALATIRPESLVELNQIATTLKANSVCRINIVGHTDNRGSDQYNQQLSEERANSVRDYLISQGVNGETLTAQGRGEAVPLAGADQSTEEGLAANRRIEFQRIN